MEDQIQTLDDTIVYSITVDSFQKETNFFSIFYFFIFLNKQDDRPEGKRISVTTDSNSSRNGNNKKWQRLYNKILHQVHFIIVV